MEISMKMIPAAVIQLIRKHGQLALTKLGKKSHLRQEGDLAPCMPKIFAPAKSVG